MARILIAEDEPRIAEFLEKVGRTARPDISEVKGTDAPF